MIDNRHVADDIIKGFERKEEELEQREVKFQREKKRQQLIAEGMDPDEANSITEDTNRVAYSS